MPRVELTVHPNYTDWGLREGVREMVQNWKDGDRDGFAGSMDFDEKKGILRLTNEGAMLGREVLLIGFSTKRGRKDLAGQFGDGLDLGCLGLVRSGCSVKIRTGTERWIPAIEPSKGFPGQEVLAFRITPKMADLGKTEVEIGGLEGDRWTELKRHFLFIERPDPKEVIECEKGKILLARPGDIFVKGIWVARVEGFQYGYDVEEKITDRERGMVKSFDLKWETARMWSEVLSRGEDYLVKRVYQMLEKNRPDVEYVETQTYGEGADKIVKEFEEEYGQDTVPVADLAQSRDMQLLGKKGAVVSEPLRKIVEKKKGETYQDTLKKLKEAVAKRYSADELTPEEWAVLDKVLAVVRIGIPELDLKNVDVVEFSDESLRGRFENGKALIRRAELASLETAMFVAIHEWSHAAGGDGTPSFEDTMLMVSVKVIVGLIEGQEEKVECSSSSTGETEPSSS